VGTTPGLATGSGADGDAGGATVARARADGKLVPRRGVLFGAFQDLDSDWTGLRSEKRAIRRYERRLGRKLKIDHHFYDWRQSWPGQFERWDVRHNRIPMVTWEPNGVDLDDIVGGRHDALIRERARQAAGFGRRLFLRWAHEMNGYWYSWGGPNNHDGGTTNGPSKYVAAWRRVQDIFVREGATNVVWVWGPNNESVPLDSWNHWRNYYPGDAYVDWVAASGFNWGALESWSSWRSFLRCFRPFYDEYAGHKPIMVAETGSTTRGGDRAKWIWNMGSDVRRKLPGIAAIVYFNSDPRWAIGPKAPGFGALKRVSNRDYFKP
jgi:hypothetical protein